MSLSLTGAIVVPALAWAALSDLLYRRISNVLIVLLLAAWLGHVAWALAQAQTTLGAVLLSLAIGSGVLVVGYLLFALRWMGGGDAKLMAVMCLWLGDQASAFLVVTAIAGGVLAIVLPLLRVVERVIAHGVLRLNALLPRPALPVPDALCGPPTAGMPYAIAIAAGAGFVLWGTA